MLARVLGLSNRTGTISGKDNHGESVLKKLLDALLRLKCAGRRAPTLCLPWSPACCLPLPLAAALPLPCRRRSASALAASAA